MTNEQIRAAYSTLVLTGEAEAVAVFEAVIVERAELVAIAEAAAEYRAVTIDDHRLERVTDRYEAEVRLCDVLDVHFGRPGTGKKEQGK